MPDPARLRSAYCAARDDLLAQRDASGHWIGELSTSALSTATATSALALVLREGGEDYPRPRLRELIERGVAWLAPRQNSDGGWGDTDKSLSNIATTMLVRAAFHLAGTADRHAEILARAEGYIESQGGLAGLRRRYGKDKTFAVPILANCALAGLVPWCEVSPLPFEVASLPNRMLGLLRIPVVSYAIPALVAIGQARYCHGKPRNPLARLARRLVWNKSLAVVDRMQPASGGFLEATPLTSFVVMSLAGTGRAAHPVVRRGVEFLLASVRGDGSWPIDTNLATWVTTLAISALAASGEDVGRLGCLDWLLACQHRQVHPFTSAAPGGWGWSDLSGAVPDADDTAGALLALAALRPTTGSEKEIDPYRSELGEAIRTALRAGDLRASSPPAVPKIMELDLSATLGLRWLLRLQNRDGGWPTFCRGWGALPFDRSGVDLTAHAIRALAAWRDTPPTDDIGVWHKMSGAPAEVVASAHRDSTDHLIARGLDFLSRRQRPDGSWVPLWFGNQYDPAEENPVYGTARVLLAYRDLKRMGSEPARRGVAWLVANQGADGGWGGRRASKGGRPGGVSSVEETAVAVEALLGVASDPAVQGVVEQGLNRLIEAVQTGRHRDSSPIGLYFAKLWYYERLYPLIFTVSALGQAVRRLCPA